MRLEEAAERLTSYLNENNLAASADHFLLAVSGGMDSMAMLEIFAIAQLPITVAHMNFTLRNEESDEDANFVRNRCLELEVPCHIQRVDCKAYAADNGLNIQSAARELRYQWFDTVLADSSANKICTAHHRDDAIETLFINLIRGTGVKGLTGIPIMRGHIIRPMMCFERNDIETVVEANGISYREDSSNVSDKYLRNKIRHRLIPLLDEVHLGSRKVLFDNIERFKEHMEAFRALESQYMSAAVSTSDKEIIISISELEKIPASEYLFLRLGGHFGFSRVQCSNLLNSDRSSGNRFLSHTHEMILDRDRIVIRPVASNTNEPVHRIHASDIDHDHHASGGILAIEEVAQPIEFGKDPNIEFVNADLLHEEMALRKWRAGDKFVPLGMTGSQKVSDILTNRKLSLFEKEDVYVLLSEDEIVWLVGVKPAERFKVTDETRRIFRLQWQPH